MFKDEKDAEQFAENFLDNLWTTEKVWDEVIIREMFSDIAIIEWQGAATQGIDACLAQWKPVQKAIATHSTLGCDLITFSDNMVSFNTYVSFSTFEKEPSYLG